MNLAVKRYMLDLVNMKHTLSEIEKIELEKLYQSFLNNDHILKMKTIPMHRGSNCYIHSFKVAKICIKKAVKKGGYNLSNLLIAAILHDYYLYDWRKNKSLKKKHGSRHPYVANENAKKDFHISSEVSEIILSHMWPLTPKSFPKSKEAKLVNYVDDLVATKEFLLSSRYKKKHEEEYLREISSLF